MKMRTSKKMIERSRKFVCAELTGPLIDMKRCINVGFGGSARKAIEKSRFDDGEEGVTMIAGRGDFSVARGKDKSRVKKENIYKLLFSH